MSNEYNKREQLITRIRDLETYVSNPEGYGLGFKQVLDMKKEIAKLYTELKSLPPEEKQSYNIRLFTLPVTVKSKDSELELQYLKDTWQITKFEHSKSTGLFGKPELILDEQGKPVSLKYLYLSTETSGENLTIVHKLLIDEEGPRPEPPKYPKPSTIVDTWTCGKCGLVNNINKLQCTCGKPRDSETAKFLGLPEDKQPTQVEKKSMFGKLRDAVNK